MFPQSYQSPILPIPPLLVLHPISTTVPLLEVAHPGSRPLPYLLVGPSWWGTSVHTHPTPPPPHEVAQLIKCHKIERNPKKSKESAEETERPWSAGSGCHSLRQERGVLKGSPGSAHGHCSPHPDPSPLRHSDNDQELSSVTAAFPAPCPLPLPPAPCKAVGLWTRSLIFSSPFPWT